MLSSDDKYKSSSRSGTFPAAPSGLETTLPVLEASTPEAASAAVATLDNGGLEAGSPDSSATPWRSAYSKVRRYIGLDCTSRCMIRLIYGNKARLEYSVLLRISCRSGSAIGGETGRGRREDERVFSYLLFGELDLVWVHLHECTDYSFLAFTVHGLHHEDWAFPGCGKSSKFGGAPAAINIKLD